MELVVGNENYDWTEFKNVSLCMLCVCRNKIFNLVTCNVDKVIRVQSANKIRGRLSTVEKC